MSTNRSNGVKRSRLNSFEVLATLFTLEMKGMVRQLPETVLQSVVIEGDSQAPVPLRTH